jgi:Kef-type K+ transport system membrane component KefB/voltage-gated potassium channel Kch
MVEQIFILLAIVLAVAFVLSFLSRILKQPLILGYIITGLVLSPFVIQFGANTDVLQTMSRFGVAFLLFIVGLHMNPRSIKEVGIPSLLIGIGQMIFTFSVGFLFSFKILGFDLTSSILIGLAVAFSSTIIVLKLISDKNDLDAIYGKIAIGVLILQDIVAIIALMVISATSNPVGILGFSGIKGVLGGLGLIIVLALFRLFIMPAITKIIAKSQELLFVFSIAWAFGVAAIFGVLGFSIEIGALVAGVILSTSPFAAEIGSKMKPLRDFFLVLFFVILGLNLQIGNIGSIIIPALVLSAIVLIFKPLILMILSALFRYTKRTNFLVGISLGQVSEFSLILVALAVSTGEINSNVLSIITLTAIITIIISSYMTIFADSLYKIISKPLRIFERKEIKREKKITKEYNVILFGYNRTGFGILKALEEIKESFLVVDFNPDTVSRLSKWRIPAVYGDAYDFDFLSELPLTKAKAVISTIPDFETNLMLIEQIKLINPKAVVILRAQNIDEALELYKKGADYVLSPYVTGGEHVAEMIKHNKIKGGGYKEEREKHIKLLGEILKSERFK